MDFFSKPLVFLFVGSVESLDCSVNPQFILNIQEVQAASQFSGFFLLLSSHTPGKVLGVG